MVKNVERVGSRRAARGPRAFWLPDAIRLGLVAIGLPMAPRLGAVAVVAALAAAAGLAAFPWTRRRSRSRESAPMGAPTAALLARNLELSKREKGLAIVAGLLLGLAGRGSHK